MHFDPFGRTALPFEHLDRDQRLALFVACAWALQEGRPVGEIAGRYMGQAFLRWLEVGGDLERDHLKIAAPRGSKLTPQRLYRLAGAGIDASEDAVEDDRLNDPA